MVQGIQFKITFLDEASEFLRTLDEAPREKIYYNIRKIAGGHKDSDLFKKTWKVPSKEIAKAEALRKKYYESK